MISIGDTVNLLSFDQVRNASIFRNLDIGPLNIGHKEGEGPDDSCVSVTYDMVFFCGKQGKVNLVSDSCNSNAVTLEAIDSWVWNDWMFKEYYICK